MGIEKSGIPLNAALAAELSEHKRQQKLTFEQIAAGTGISLRQVKRIFNDERSMDTLELEKVSRRLGKSSSSILAGALARLEEHDGI